MQDKKICLIVTSSLAIRTLCVGQVENLASQGAKVTLIAAPGQEHQVVTNEGGVSVAIPMERNPAILSDIVSLFRLWVYLLFNRQDLVVVSTPKASLLGSIAAFMSFHKNVIFIVRGCAFENFTGRRLAFYHFLEKLICTLSRKVQFVSKELMSRYVEQNLCNPRKAFIIGGGSSKGIDLKRFDPSRFSATEKRLLRNEYSISKDAFVWLYCGRVRRDKGINELIKAYSSLKHKFPSWHLLLVGPYEDWDALDREAIDCIRTDSSITHIPWVDDVTPFMAISDAFAFPSHREGFGNVAIEAAAMGLPVVAFNVIGCRESVKHGVSGLLVDAVGASGLEEAMGRLVLEEGLYTRLHETARPWVAKNFDKDYVCSEIVKVYSALIE